MFCTVGQGMGMAGWWRFDASLREPGAWLDGEALEGGARAAGESPRGHILDCEHHQGVQDGAYQRAHRFELPAHFCVHFCRIYATMRDALRGFRLRHQRTSNRHGQRTTTN